MGITLDTIARPTQDDAYHLAAVTAWAGTFEEAQLYLLHCPDEAYEGITRTWLNLLAHTYPQDVEVTGEVGANPGELMPPILYDDSYGRPVEEMKEISDRDKWALKAKGAAINGDEAKVNELLAPLREKDPATRAEWSTFLLSRTLDRMRPCGSLKLEDGRKEGSLSSAAELTGHPVTEEDFRRVTMAGVKVSMAYLLNDSELTDIAFVMLGDRHWFELAGRLQKELAQAVLLRAKSEHQDSVMLEMLPHMLNFTNNMEIIMKSFMAGVQFGPFWEYANKWWGPKMPACGHPECRS